MVNLRLCETSLISSHKKSRQLSILKVMLKDRPFSFLRKRKESGDERLIDSAKDRTIPKVFVHQNILFLCYLPNCIMQCNVRRRD